MMKITEAKIDHLNGLTDLFDAYRVWYRKASDKKNARTFLKQRLQSNDSVIYLAMDETEQVGFTQLYPSFSSTKMKRLWILNDLYVKPSHRGRGLSRKLIATAQQLCSDTDGCGVLLETELSNTIGNRLYPSMGFKLEENNFYFWTVQNQQAK